jgi:hypothetical protein
MNSENLTFRPNNFRLYGSPLHHLPHKVLTLLLNETKEPSNILSAFDTAKIHSDIASFFAEDIKFTGKSYIENLRYHKAQSYLFMRKLLQDGMLDDELFLEISK